MDRVSINRKGWDVRSALYQREAQRAGMYTSGAVEWGPNSYPESELKILGDVRGKNILEVGCGGAQFGIALARKGARVTGIDLSKEQLRHAKRNAASAEVEIRLEHGNAEDLSRFKTNTFDLVVSDFAAGFLDLAKLLPEVRRVLKPGGRTAISWSSPILDCLTPSGEPPLLKFVTSYFDTAPIRDGGPDPTYEFKRTYGEWIRAFVLAGLIVLDLVEPQTERGGTHTWWPQYKWQRTHVVPGTSIWVAEKPSVGKVARRRT
ncbi:MAG: class I SAM-dependent methyltransferase [Actinomycetota bacterium]|nr:class I SAM-dependent methyltransferase [Actinomycetota bacterium]